MHEPRPDEPSSDRDEALVLVVDDDEVASQLVARWLEREGFQCQVHGSAESLLQGLSQSLPDAICLDLGLPGMSGLDAMELVRQRHRTVPIVVLTAERSPGTVVTAMRAGAHDYLVKPLERIKVTTTVRNAVEHHRLESQVRQLRRDAEHAEFAGIVGRSAAIRSLFRQLDRIAASDITVLVQGESGTGKELVARAIHDNSARRRGPLVAVNCAAIPESLQDSALFGHEKGAFTGADQARPGRFEQANGGTLFLDEVAELSSELQAKLLRVLQERKFERVGGRTILTSDFRLVAATHRDLAAMVKEGKFREDLFFRLAVLELHVPPLREREGDVPLLVNALLEKMAHEAGRECPKVAPAAMELMLRHSWRGNVRELHNSLQRAFVVCEGGVIQINDLPPRMLQDDAADDPSRDTRSAPSTPSAGPSTSVAAPAALPNLAGASMVEIERAAIEAAMASAGGNLSEVTRRLGIGRATLYRRLKKYGLR
ncbi:MAG: sigma-54 dependent transcriptional regulator [Deltaproteobacteria bacterium]|nr:sigma-54 dependent transcriptional regulator [Deltaproteobacteria bacterium]